jgi:excisionase family DNA binding protein
MNNVEEQLAELNREVRKLVERLEIGTSSLPQLLTYQRAAHELSVSLTKVRRLIKAGVLPTIKLGGRKYIPSREIERIARSASTQNVSRLRTSGGRPKAKRYDAKEEAAKLRAKLKKLAR